MRVRRHPDPPADGLGGGGAQPVGLAPGPDEPQQLRHPHVPGVGFTDPLPECARAGDELLGLVEPPVDDGQRRAAGQGEVVVAGLPEPVRGEQVVVERHPERRGPLLEQRVGREQQALGVPLGVTGTRGQLGDLAGQPDPLGRPAR